MSAEVVPLRKPAEGHEPGDARVGYLRGPYRVLRLLRAARSGHPALMVRPAGSPVAGGSISVVYLRSTARR
jgi:hypothetical protein